MERYREISIADLFELISKGDTSSVYYQGRNKCLFKADDDTWSFSVIKKFKWFIREVIE